MTRFKDRLLRRAGQIDIIRDCQFPPRPKKLLAIKNTNPAARAKTAFVSKATAGTACDFKVERHGTKALHPHPRGADSNN